MPGSPLRRDITRRDNAAMERVSVAVVRLIVGSLFMDGHVGAMPQPISYLTMAVDIGCVVYVRERLADICVEASEREQDQGGD